MPLRELPARFAAACTANLHWLCLIILGLLSQLLYLRYFLRPYPLLRLHAVPLLDLGKVTSYSHDAARDFVLVFLLLFALSYVAYVLCRGRSSWLGLLLVLLFAFLCGLALVEPVRHLQPLSRFPSVSQDMSLIVDEGIPAQQMEDVIRKAGGELLVGVDLFDVYRGDPIPAGKKSLAYSLTYRHDERTLTDKQVAKVHAKIINRLSKELGANLRE